MRWAVQGEDVVTFTDWGHAIRSHRLGVRSCFLQRCHRRRTSLRIDGPPQLRALDPSTDDGRIAAQGGRDVGQCVGMSVERRMGGVLDRLPIHASVEKRSQRGSVREASGIDVVARRSVRLEGIAQPLGQARRPVQKRIRESVLQSSSDELRQAGASHAAIRCPEGGPHVPKRKEIWRLLESDREAIAAPGVVLRPGGFPGADRIEREIPKDSARVSTVLDDAATVSPLQNVADAAMSPVEALTVCRVQLLQQARD